MAGGENLGLVPLGPNAGSWLWVVDIPGPRCHPPPVTPSATHGSRNPDSEAQKTLRGRIDRVTYHDEGSLYTVLRIVPEAGYKVPSGDFPFASERATAVGRAIDPIEGMRVRLVGKWGKHKDHGHQFEFEALHPLPPVDEDGLVRYLASKAFDGIGETIARRIVDTLGVTTLETIRDHPESLDRVTGLRASVKQGLVATVQAQLAMHSTIAFLLGQGLGPRQAQSVVSKLGGDCEGPLRENPYLLTQVQGLGFATADKVASELDIKDNDPRRLRAGLLHTLERASDQGHSLVRLGELCMRADDLLGNVAPRAAWTIALAELEDSKEVRIDRALAPDLAADDDEHPVYLPWLHGCENGVAVGIDRLMRMGEAESLASPSALQQAELAAGITLHPDQRKAVLDLLAKPVGVLTGGPGVGKTTIVRLIAALAEAAGLKVLLASPTGRAAKRLSEATGRPASTVHRLLRYQPPGGFQHGLENPIEAGLVLVDEISMLDVALANSLVKAIAPPTRLLLVGDPDQLPSVGAGNVLADLIHSGQVPVARLSQVYRQGAESLIVKNAHRLLQGLGPELPARGVKDADFYLFPEEDAAATANRLVEVVTERIPNGFGLDWQSDVQVLTPMYKGECGADNLNDRLRNAAGHGGREVEIGQRRWRVGDRVIHTRNDYEKEVFNGDMGHIRSIAPDGLLTVKFPDRDVVYETSQLSDLRPAFAITVHRSQGGEFPAVVMPLVTGHRMMMQRNLLYTAITRARQLLVLVGSQRALSWAVENADPALRESRLDVRLQLLAEAR